MLTAKPVSTPMSPTPKLSLLSGTTLDDAKEYRAVLGNLQYLSLTFVSKSTLPIYAPSYGYALAGCQKSLTVSR